MWYTKAVKNFRVAVQICHSSASVMFLGTCLCIKNEARKQAKFAISGHLFYPNSKVRNMSDFRKGNYGFWVKRKGLLRLHTNPSVRSFYNPLLVESKSIHTGIVSMVCLVHWSILYWFLGSHFLLTRTVCPI